MSSRPGSSNIHRSDSFSDPPKIKLSLRDERMFTLQLSVLLAAGVPILKSLEAMARTEDSSICKGAKRLAYKLATGWTLADSMLQLDNAFDRTTVSIVKVGENTGRLSDALKEASRRCERVLMSRTKLLQAITYPAAVFGVSILMLMFLSCYMLPRFLPIFTAAGASIPWPTKVLLFVTKFRLYLLLLLLVMVSVVAVVIWAPHPTLTKLRTKMMLKFPFIGGCNRLITCADICADLALLLRSGIPMTEALDTISRTDLENPLYAALQRVRGKLLQGEPFIEALEGEYEIPAVFVSTLAAGGESGQVSELLDSLGEILREQAEHSQERLLTLLEPFMLGFMGVVVGFVLLGCFLPIYRMLTVSL